MTITFYPIGYVKHSPCIKDETRFIADESTWNLLKRTHCFFPTVTDFDFGRYAILWISKNLMGESRIWVNQIKVASAVSHVYAKIVQDSAPFRNGYSFWVAVPYTLLQTRIELYLEQDPLDNSFPALPQDPLDSSYKTMEQKAIDLADYYTGPSQSHELFCAGLVARSIFEQTTFMVLATASGNNPWVSPVFFTADESNCLYFVSSFNSCHVKNLVQNPSISVSIYNTNQLEGDANGLQMSGTAKAVEIDDYPRVLGLIFKKLKIPNGNVQAKIQEYTEKNRGIFKVTPEVFYLQDPNHWLLKRIDRRIRVNMKP